MEELEVSGKMESSGLWKATPKLRRFAQQSARPHDRVQETDWRSQVARQQAAIKYQAPFPPKKKESKPKAPSSPETITGQADEPDQRKRSEQSAAGLPDLPQAHLNLYLRLNRAEFERIQQRRDAGISGQEKGTLQSQFQIDLGDQGKVAVDFNGDIGIASVREDQLESVLENDVVETAELAEPVRRPLVLKGSASPGMDSDPILRRIPHQDIHGGGRGVLMGIIDVEGFDFSHPDFLNENGTRFISIWDQGGSGFRPGPKLRGDERVYGSEFTRELLNAALEKSKTTGLAPYHLEPQSVMLTGSHGTHVASTAAGRTGLCPNADIAGVLVHLPEKDLDRRRSFTDSTRIADAISYLMQIKEQNPDRYHAISINISLGTNGHAHDGTSLASRRIDSELDRQGCCISIAAGNAGQEEAENVDDMGFIVGRIHTSSRLDAAGLTKDIHVHVAGFPIHDISENEIEIWYAPQDRFAVSVRPPGGGQWSEKVTCGSPFHEEIARDSDSKNLNTVIGISSEMYRPENGSNHISVFLTPANEEGAYVEPGIWTIRLHAEEIRDGRFDGWIERDDPIPVDGMAPYQLYYYPSFFSGESNVDRSSISTIACTRSAISVANIDDRAEQVAISSSQGPSRDGRNKPEVGAPGTRILAARGFFPSEKEDGEMIAMTGTSMASPYVAGVAGLMLAIEPTLTHAQIRGIMIRTASPLPGANYNWRDDAGYGLIDAKRCIEEVIRFRDLLKKT